MPEREKAEETEEIGETEGTDVLAREKGAEEMDTVIDRKDDETEIRKKQPDNPILVWNNLIGRKKEIGAQLLFENLDEVDKKRLEQERKEVSLEIIEQGCKILDRDFNAEKEEIEKIEEDRWRKSIEAAYGDEEKYKTLEQKMLVETALQREMDDIINKKWEKISESERKKYNNDVGQFYERAKKNVFDATADNEGKNGIIVSKEAFCGMLQKEFDPEDSRAAGWWETIKHSVGRLAAADVIFDMLKEGELVAIPFTDPSGGRKGSEIMTHKKFEEFIKKSETDFEESLLKRPGTNFEEIILKISEQRKELIIGQSIEQTVLNEEIKKITDAILAKQGAEREAKKAERGQAKIKEAQEIPDKKRLAYLKELRDKWDKANLRYLKIKEIEKTLKEGRATGEYKIKGEKGLENEKAKAKMEKFKEELLNKNAGLSDEIIDIADKITGRNLRKDALAATGYDPRNPEAEKLTEFRKYLTKEVQKIYKESAEALERATGKKLRIKKIKTIKTTAKPGPVKPSEPLPLLTDLSILIPIEEIKPLSKEEMPVLEDLDLTEEEERALLVEHGLIPEAAPEESELSKLVQEFKEDFEQGMTGYVMETKIRHGETFKGQTENNIGAEHYMIFNEFGNMLPGLKRLVGFRANKNLPTFWYKKSESAIFLGPIRNRKSGAALTLKDCGVAGKHESEEVCALSILYLNSSEKYFDKRPGLQTVIESVVRKNLANQILEEIKKDPKNLWKFIESFEPELLRVTAPSEMARPRVGVYNGYERKINRQVEPEIIEAK